MKPTTRARCSHCERRKPLDEFRLLPSGPARCCLECEPIRAERLQRFRTRDAKGPMPSRRICIACHGQSWRVVGERCDACGLAYAPERAARADGEARNPGALARFI